MEETLVMVGQQRGQVALESCLNHGVFFPRRLVGQAPFQFVERKGQLKRHWVFRPERSVIVEHGDAFGGGDEVG